MPPNPFCFICSYINPITARIYKQLVNRNSFSHSFRKSAKFFPRLHGAQMRNGQAISNGLPVCFASSLISVIRNKNIQRLERLDIRHSVRKANLSVIIVHVDKLILIVAHAHLLHVGELA